MTVVEDTHELASAGWGRQTTPAVTVLVSTYGRPGYLHELIASLEQQDFALDEFEVVVVDNGSRDDTWEVLTELAMGTPLRLLVLRLDDNRGPAGGRNYAATRARAPVLAITDDDCLPTRGWVQAIRDAFADQHVTVLQGRVEPHPAQHAVAGPWDHTVTVRRPTPFFETCNVAYRREAFVDVGGFDEKDPLFQPRTGRAFGEDARLGWQVQQRGGRTVFRDDAVVYHRCIPGSFGRYLRDHRHAAGFPGLAKRSPLVADWLRGRVFLTRASAAFDVAVAGALLALATRSPWPLAATLPWLRVRWRASLTRTRGDRLRAVPVLGQYCVLDGMTLLSLIEGSVRHRRLVL